MGCSGSFPGPDSAASCYLVEAEYGGGTFRLVLDLGNGALGSLQRHAPLESIGAVMLSHLHADHCLDLCSFYVVRKYHPEGPLGPLTVYGPSGAGDRIARAYDLPSAEAMAGEFTFRAYPEEAFTVGPFTVSVARVDHPGTSYALGLSDGAHTLVYSGDTAPCDSIDQFASGADLLLAEASFVETADNPEHLHMTGREAATLAERAGVGRLVLTHIPPWHSPEAVLAEASPHFTGTTTLACAGASFVV